MTAKQSAKRKVEERRDVLRRKPDDKRRESVIQVLATAEEKEAWKVLAESSGMSVSSWLRQMANKAWKG